MGQRTGKQRQEQHWQTLRQPRHPLSPSWADAARGLRARFSRVPATDSAMSGTTPFLGQEFHQRQQRRVHRPVGLHAHYIAPGSGQLQVRHQGHQPAAGQLLVDQRRAAQRDTHATRRQPRCSIRSGPAAPAAPTDPGPAGRSRCPRTFRDCRRAFPPASGGARRRADHRARRATPAPGCTPAPRSRSSAGCRRAAAGAGRARARAGRPGRCPGPSRPDPGWRAGIPAHRCPDAVR